MSDENSGPLDSGSWEARYLLIGNSGVLHAHEDDVQQARERRDEIFGDMDLDVHVVREDRRVIPDSVTDVDVRTLDVLYAARVHSALDAGRAILEGDADELDARRPHPPRYAFLYDVAETLRNRDERLAEVESEVADAPDKLHNAISSNGGAATDE